jgi:hypothetical protein
LQGHTQHIYDLAWSKDGSRLASASYDGSVGLWDTTQLIQGNVTLLAQLRGHSDQVRTVAVRAQERIGKLSLALDRGGSYNYDYRLHVLRGQERLGTIARDQTNGYWHSTYTFTPDGQQVLSGGQNGILQLYTLDGTTRATLVGHTGEIKAVAISADGRWALSGANDQTLNLWSLAALPASHPGTVQPTLTLFPAANGEWIAWIPEGFFTASPQGTRLIGFSINQGLEKLAKYVFMDQLYDRFYRPDLIQARLHGDPQKLWQKEGALKDVNKVLTNGLPPLVVFMTPPTSTTVTQREVDIQVKILDQGGGIPQPAQSSVQSQTPQNQPSQVQPNSPPRLYMLVVGINRYRDKALQLNYAVPDGKALIAAVRPRGRHQPGPFAALPRGCPCPQKLGVDRYV